MSSSLSQAGVGQFPQSMTTVGMEGEGAENEQQTGEIPRKRNEYWGDNPTYFLYPISYLSHFLLKLLYVKFPFHLEKALINSGKLWNSLSAAAFPICVTLGMLHKPSKI